MPAGPRLFRESVGGVAAVDRNLAPLLLSPISEAPKKRAFLQWLLEERGWHFLRAVVDGLAATVATLLVLGHAAAQSGVSEADLLLLTFPAMVVILLALRGLYRPRIQALFLDLVAPVAGAISVAAMGVLVISVLALHGTPGEGEWLKSWLSTVVAVLAGELVLFKVQRFCRRRGLIGRPVLILGAGLVGSQIANRLESHPEYGLRPVGFLDDDPPPPNGLETPGVPVVGSVEELDAFVLRTGVEHVIVAFSATTDARVSPLVQRCQELGVAVSVVPRMFDTVNHRISYDTVGGLPLLSCRVVSPTSLQFAFKYGLDRLLATFLLLALSPLMLFVAIAVRLSSPGPVFFRQRRVGRDGKQFDLYKFRSMRAASGSSSLARLRRGLAPGGVEEEEDRRTWIGKLIRRTGIDELPQLINVVKGEMSLVGPRPERPEFVELFEAEINRYGDRLRVKSGITGWAQVHGLRGRTSLAERVEWDNYYISHWSPWLDLKILILTLLTPFQGVD